MFDDFDFGDTHESEANDYNPYESNADSDNSCLPDDFCLVSRCELCDCQEFLWPVKGYICDNCGHHYDHHL